VDASAAALRVSTDTRSRAVQAFWAMLVEALNRSGMSVRDYANALLLSPWSLRKWRDRRLWARLARREARRRA
jgi:hypothetical protein